MKNKIVQGNDYSPLIAMVIIIIMIVVYIKTGEKGDNGR